MKWATVISFWILMGMAGWLIGRVEKIGSEIRYHHENKSKHPIVEGYSELILWKDSVMKLKSIVDSLERIEWYCTIYEDTFYFKKAYFLPRGEDDGSALRAADIKVICVQKIPLKELLRLHNPKIK